MNQDLAYDDQNYSRAYLNPVFIEHYFKEKTSSLLITNEQTIGAFNYVSFFSEGIKIVPSPKKVGGIEPYDAQIATTSHFEADQKVTIKDNTQSLNSCFSNIGMEYLRIINLNMSSNKDEIIFSLKKLNKTPFLLSLSGKAKGPKDLARKKHKYY